MRTSLSTDEREQYERDGYLALDGFLSVEELDHMRAAVTEALELIGRQRVAGNPELAEVEGYESRVTQQRVNLWKVNATVRRYLQNEDLGRMLGALAGIEGVRVWHDQTFFKPPWGNPTAFHLDMPNWSFWSPTSIQIWIALDDATQQSGCLYYLPGSHRVVRCDTTASIRGDVGALFDVYPELRAVEAKPAEARAGDAIVHNGLTVHAAGANMTPRWRRAMSCQYMPDGATFNGNPCILSREQLARLRVGDVLNDESQNPLVWRTDGLVTPRPEAGRHA